MSHSCSSALHKQSSSKSTHLHSSPAACLYSLLLLGYSCDEGFVKFLSNVLGSDDDVGNDDDATGTSKSGSEKALQWQFHSERQCDQEEVVLEEISCSSEEEGVGSGWNETCNLIRTSSMKLYYYVLVEQWSWLSWWEWGGYHSSMCCSTIIDERQRERRRHICRGV